MDVTLHLAGFLIAAALIVFSGSKLSKYGDMMADMKGWGKLFVGMILLALVTSLPELMTGISAMVIVDAPDLAVGDIVGSCAFNILILSILDLFLPKRSVTSEAQTGHVIAAGFSVVLLAMLGFAILKPQIFGTIIWMGGFSVMFLAIYFIAVRVVFLYEKKQPLHETFKQVYKLTFRQVVARYVLNAAVVMAAALTLPFFGEKLAAASGLGESFFGTLFIAFSTSLPELVVSVAAIRLGSINMAMGNIFGSNIFNIGILALEDVIYTKGPIFLFTSPGHIIPVLGTIIITAIGIIGIVFKSDKKWKLGIDTGAILLTYVLMMALLYNVRE